MFRITPLKQCSLPKLFCIFHKAALNNHKAVSENTWCKHNYQPSEGYSIHVNIFQSNLRGDEQFYDKKQSELSEYLIHLTYYWKELNSNLSVFFLKNLHVHDSNLWQLFTSTVQQLVIT